jgi:PIN domain nuclease of toxin-antitoxin system
VQLLLDTHVLLWTLSGDDRLGTSAVDTIADGRNVVYVSSVSVWEVATKRSLGKLRAPADLVAAVDAAGFRHLPLSLEHADAVSELPGHHRDPFDRMLIAQARTDRLTLMTHGAVMQRYDVQLIAV